MSKLLADGTGPLGPAEAVHRMVDRFTPIKGEGVSLHYASPSLADEAWNGEYAGVLTLLLVWWDIDEEKGVRTVSNIKEQHCAFERDDGRNLLRLEQFFLGWVPVAREVLGNDPNILPSDMFRGMHSALQLKAVTKDDFAKALRAKSRLGKFL